jgi:hypothetical protein
MDQSSFAAPHSLSQRITSFIACACQGIHQLPLRHLIVLIANAHHLLDLEFLSPSLSLRGVPNLTMRTSRIGQTQRSGYLLQPNPLNDAIDVFNRHALLELRRAARLQSVIKTSFSRSNPVPRGQATVIRPFVRDAPKDTNNERSRVTGFLPTSDPSPISGRLGHRKVHRERFRTPWVKNPKHLEASRSIFSSQCMQNRHQAVADANFYFSRRHFVLTRRRRCAGAPNDWRRASRASLQPHSNSSRPRQREDQIWWS